MKKTVENLVNKWKVILHKAKNIDESFLLKGENVSRRNNTRKNLLKYLEMSLKDKDDEAEIKNLKIKIVEIEDKLNETLKGEAPYLNVE